MSEIRINTSFPFIHNDPISRANLEDGALVLGVVTLILGGVAIIQRFYASFQEEKIDGLKTDNAYIKQKMDEQDHRNDKALQIIADRPKPQAETEPQIVIKKTWFTKEIRF